MCILPHGILLIVGGVLFIFFFSLSLPIPPSLVFLQHAVDLSILEPGVQSGHCSKREPGLTKAEGQSQSPAGQVGMNGAGALPLPPRTL